MLEKRKGCSKTKLSAKERKTLVNDARKKTYPGIKEEVLLFTRGGRGFGNLKIVSQQSICRQQQVQLNSWAMRGSCTLLPTFFSWAPGISHTFLFIYMYIDMYMYN